MGQIEDCRVASADRLGSRKVLLENETRCGVTGNFENDRV